MGEILLHSCLYRCGLSCPRLCRQQPSAPSGDLLHAPPCAAAAEMLTQADEDFSCFIKAEFENTFGTRGPEATS